MIEHRLLTKEEVQKLNTEGAPGMMYLIGKLEWEEGYDYWLIPGTGSSVKKVQKENK